MRAASSPGLTRYTNKGHLGARGAGSHRFSDARSGEAMEQDAGVRVDILRADGGMVGNNLLMQFQADILNRTVVCPRSRRLPRWEPPTPPGWP